MSAFRNQLLSHREHALDEQVVVGRQIACLVGIEGFNPRDESAHTIVLDNAPCIDCMTIQRGDEAETITERCGKVARGAQDSDDRNAHGAARHLHARIERIALHDGIEAQPLRFDNLLD